MEEALRSLDDATQWCFNIELRAVSHRIVEQVSQGNNGVTMCFLGIPAGPLIGMALAFFLLGRLVLGVKQPLAWIVVAFIAICNGVGCARYGVAQARLGSKPRTTQQLEWISKRTKRNAFDAWTRATSHTNNFMDLVVVWSLARHKSHSP